jgi:hypothetical protein
MVKSHSELFSLWCNTGRGPVIRVSHKRDVSPITQGYPSRISTYAFKED